LRVRQIASRYETRAITPYPQTKMGGTIVGPFIMNLSTLVPPINPSISVTWPDYKVKQTHTHRHLNIQSRQLGIGELTSSSLVFLGNSLYTRPSMFRKFYAVTLRKVYEVRCVEVMKNDKEAKLDNVARTILDAIPLNNTDTKDRDLYPTLVALFLTKGIAQSCFATPHLSAFDARWKCQTISTFQALRIFHPGIAVKSLEDLYSMPLEDWVLLRHTSRLL